MLTNTAPTETKMYDPMYCLSEHLDYFNESVAGKHDILKTDFDDIFTRALKRASLSLVPNPMQKAKLSDPLDLPKPVLSMPPTASPTKPTMREQAVVSPTTVTSNVIFSEMPQASPPAPEQVQSIAPALKASRKRKMSETEAPSSPKPDDKEDVRRERNRRHAKKSRQRRRQITSELEQSVQALKTENEKLIELLGLTPQDSQAMADKDAAKNQAATDSFIDALKQPKNGVLSDDALSSLRELFSS